MKPFALRSLALLAAVAMPLQFAVAQSRSDGQVPFTRGPSPRMQTGAADQVMARNIEMGVGRSIVVDLPRDAKEVFVANPAVANAVVRSARKLFVIGVANGTTTIMALDAEGRQIAALEMAIGREPGLLQRTLKTAIPHADIRASVIGNSTVLTGVVDTVLDAQKAVDIASSFSGGAPAAPGAPSAGGGVINSLTIRGKDQVMLKVTVAEVNRQMLKQLGVRLDGSWEINGKIIGATIGSAAGSAIAAGAGNLATTNGQVPFNPLNVLTQPSGTGATARLNALERHGMFRTLAEPTLTAISGETAKFMAGGEIPVPVSEESTVSGGSRITFSYKPYGVMLNFTPTVLSEGRISLSVGTEVTDVDESSTNSRTVGASGNKMPAFRNRKAYTTIELPSGGSLVTAGLIQQTSRQALNGLPGLINLPVIGALFRSREFYREDTELMIMVTPYIAKPSAPKDIVRPDQGLYEAADGPATLLGRINKVYGAAGSPPPPTQYRGKVGFIHE